MFKKDFVWGAATAATQIEGAYNEDGKGQTIWDVFPHETENFMSVNDDAKVACDHYHRYKQDVQLMKKLGINAYRFSVSWARIIPDGVGEVNPKGIEFYNNLIDELIANGIEPYVTLFHWDLPYALYDNGNGWLDRNIADAFANYAKVVADNFADRVHNFITINEPQCIINNVGGVDPSRQYTVKEQLTIVHNILLAHGKMAQVLHNYPNVKVGYAPCISSLLPKTDSNEDVECARKALFDISHNSTWNVVLWSDPVVFGKYPDKYYEVFSQDEQADILQGDMEIIGKSIDFYCQNIYTSTGFIASDGKGGSVTEEYSADVPVTAMDWPITPKALYYIPKFLYERYKLPFFITENGTACDDKLTIFGKVHDKQRVDYLNDYIKEYQRAIADGIDGRGYFCWSLLDNFEWKFGYTKRFGLLYTDYATQKRYPKDSYKFYRKVIKTNGKVLK